MERSIILQRPRASHHDIIWQSMIYVYLYLHCSAATEFRCGGRFYLIVFCSLSTNPRVKELLKSVHICQSYRKNISGPVFFDSQCISVCLEPVLQFLLSSLHQSVLATSAADALQCVCSQCPDQMTVHFDALVRIVTELDTFDVSNDAAIGLLKGSSLVTQLLLVLQRGTTCRHTFELLLLYTTFKNLLKTHLFIQSYYTT